MSTAAADEDAPGPRDLDRRLLGQLLPYLRPHRAALALAVLLVVVTAALDLLGPYLTKLAIDGPVRHGSVGGLAWIAAAYLLSLVLGTAARIGHGYLLQATGQRVLAEMRGRAYSHLLRMDAAYYDRHPVGRLMTRVTSDVEAVNELFTANVVTVLGDVLTLLGIMGALLLIDWRLALVSFAVLPLFGVLAHWFRRGSRASLRKGRTLLAALNAFLHEYLVGLPVVHLFRREERARRAFSEINERYTEAALAQAFYPAVFRPAVELLAAVAIALILLYGGGGVLAGTITLGALVAFVQYSDRFWQPVADLSEKFDVLQRVMASCERLFSLLDTRPQIVAPARPVPLPEVQGRVAFEGVWFRYGPDRDWALENVEFVVEPGRTVALVGATGAGKTTAAGLLARFYDVERGRVTLDGVDVRELDPAQLRSALATVLQDVRVSAGTVASNIHMGAPLSPEAVRAAARAVGADRFIEALPDGYETAVGEHGVDLSVGQRQLLSFARALARDPRVLILDEATSALDADSERLLRSGFEALRRGRTTLVIAHRLSTIQESDEILVFHKGRIRERGTHQVLLARRGVYWKLYQLQYAAGRGAAAAAQEPPGPPAGAA